MLEGSPPASPPSSEGTETTPPTEPTEGQVDEVVNPPARTVEEVEAIWKGRISGKDRAHAEEVRVLREQIARATAPKVPGDPAEDWETKAKETAALLEEERKARALDVRSVKYAAAAESLDEATLASMDEAKLAALNARLSGDEAPPPPVVDPSTAPRSSAAPPTAPREKSVGELESDLKKFEPEFAATLDG